jgi:hypothetical protein
MDLDRALTYGSIWLALVLYTASAGALAFVPGTSARSLSRWLHTLACLAFLAHVAAAFQFFHHWSHAAAQADTARQTAEFTGWNWSGGLYFNYAFALLWVGEIAWLWTSPAAYWRRPGWITWSVRIAFLFMLVNGAVVFVRGPRRWMGLFLCLGLAVCWWKERKREVDTPGGPA